MELGRRSVGFANPAKRHPMRHTHNFTFEIQCHNGCIGWLSNSYRMTEIVNIEKDAYEKFAGQFDHFVKKMMEMGRRGSDKRLGEWMDNQEVCDRLRISPRTLQTLRDNGTLAYSQISHKTYYKPEDVESIMRVVAERRKMLHGESLESPEPTVL